MATETSNIDDILTQNTPNHLPKTSEAAGEPQPSTDEQVIGAQAETSEDYHLNDEPEPENVPHETKSNLDEYGNESAPTRTYTQEEADEYANRIVRDRLARLEQRTGQQFTPQQQAQQVQAAQDGFQYDQNSNETWHQQLEQFVEQTFHKMNQRTAQQAQQLQEQQANMAFEAKFTQSMGKFKDFKEVITNLGADIPDHIVKATRGMKDPAAFLYAAAKRAPGELKEIISKSDPYEQIAAIGRLDMKLRQEKPASKAPRPLGKTQEDLAIPHKNDKEPTIEDMIAKADAKRRAQLAQRRR